MLKKLFIIKEVKDAFTKKEFFQLPIRLYKNEKNWICPIYNVFENIFDPSKNKYFLHGKCTRWILQNEKGVTLGRVAAFIDFNTKDIFDQPTGGMGFFECVNDIEVAFTLFDKCKSWLEEQGIEAMDGPINFGPRYEWWGLLSEGFEHRPIYNMPYTHKYYIRYFERYGFKVYFKQLTFRTLAKKESMKEIVKWKADRLFKNPDYTFEHFKKSQFNKYIKDFVVIYNKTWVYDIPGTEKITEEEVKNSMEDLKPILVEKIMWFAYHKGIPIGFFIIVPDANEILKHLKGKFNWKAKLYFLWYKYFAKSVNTIGLIFGVAPEYQKRGIEAGLIKKYVDAISTKKNRYKTLEMNWIGDFNPRMIHLMEHTGGQLYKTHITYRKLFDETRKFKRAPIIK